MAGRVGGRCKVEPLVFPHTLPHFAPHTLTHFLLPGGFFASGFKRAFKLKDFGDTIPGHGGITDRFDCQVRRRKRVGMEISGARCGWCGEGKVWGHHHWP